MLKRILGAMIMVPVILIFAGWGVNLVVDILAGNIDLIAYLQAHKVIIAIIVTYLVFKHVNPFKKNT